MNKCEELRPVILTDYLDSETDEKTGRRIEEHLAACAGCRALLEEARKEAEAPFSQAERAPVPEGLWEAVRERIGEHVPLAERLRRFFLGGAFGELAPVMGVIAMCLVVGGLVAGQRHQDLARDKAQAEYLLALASPESVPATENAELNPIEQYFL
jgi:predicted anti-sigma-YlaC factor YlaD